MIQKTEFRVVKTGQGFFEIHEVYYDNSGKIVTSSRHATSLREQTLNDLINKLERISNATSKNVLILEDI